MLPMIRIDTEILTGLRQRGFLPFSASVSRSSFTRRIGPQGRSRSQDRVCAFDVLCSWVSLRYFHLQVFFRPPCPHFKCSEWSISVGNERCVFYLYLVAILPYVSNKGHIPVHLENQSMQKSWGLTYFLT